MATGTPGYPSLGTDLNGKPLSPIYQGGKVAQPKAPPTHVSLGNGAVSVLTHGLQGETIPAAQTPVDVQALRTMLVKAGYNIPKAGSAPGSLFKAALRDYLQPTASHPVAQRILALVGASKAGQPLVSGLRDPESFNQRYGLHSGGTITPPTKAYAPRLNPNGTPTAADVVSMDDAHPSSGPTIDLSGLAQIMKGIHGIGSESPMISTSLADQLAGQQHDAQIRDLGVQALRQGRDANQSLADIGHWYNQVGAAENTAATRDSAASAAGTQSVQDAVSKIVASLGGSANQGAGLVGAAGADQAGLLSALGANQDQYNADLKPLLAAEGADARARQQATNTKDAQDIQNSIIDQEGQRGSDKAAALLQIMGLNQDRRNANNSLEQQRFGDNLAVQNAYEAAALNGAKVQGYLSKAATPPKPAKGSFAASSSTDRSKFAGALQSSLVDSSGHLLKGMSRSKAVSIAQRLAHLYFPQGGIPNGSGVIKGILANAGL